MIIRFYLLNGKGVKWEMVNGRWKAKNRLGIETLYNIVHPILSILHKTDQILLIEGSLATSSILQKKGSCLSDNLPGSISCKDF